MRQHDALDIVLILSIRFCIPIFNTDILIIFIYIFLWWCPNAHIRNALSWSVRSIRFYVRAHDLKNRNQLNIACECVRQCDNGHFK